MILNATETVRALNSMHLAQVIGNLYFILFFEN